MLLRPESLNLALNDVQKRNFKLVASIVHATFMEYLVQLTSLVQHTRDGPDAVALSKWLFSQRDIKLLYQDAHYAFRESLFDQIGLFLDRLLELV